MTFLSDRGGFDFLDAERVEWRSPSQTWRRENGGRMAGQGWTRLDEACLHETVGSRETRLVRINRQLERRRTELTSLSEIEMDAQLDQLERLAADLIDQRADQSVLRVNRALDAAVSEARRFLDES